MSGIRKMRPSRGLQLLQMAMRKSSSSSQENDTNEPSTSRQPKRPSEGLDKPADDSTTAASGYQPVHTSTPRSNESPESKNVSSAIPHVLTDVQLEQSDIPSAGIDITFESDEENGINTTNLIDMIDKDILSVNSTVRVDEISFDDSDNDATYIPPAKESSDSDSSEDTSDAIQVEQLRQDNSDSDSSENISTAVTAEQSTPVDNDENTSKKSKGVNKRLINKEKRRKGEVYQAKRRKGENIEVVTKQPRHIGDRCKHKKRGCSKITDAQREDIFTNFWKMTWEQRRVYVSTLVLVTEPNRKTLGELRDSRRSNTFRYRLNVNNEVIQVCQEMFLSTLNIGAWSVRSWAKASETGIIPPQTNMPSRSRSQQDGSVSTFLTRLPKMESHYCRRDTTKQYLEPTFTGFSDLHQQYVTFCGEENLQACSVTTLKKTFNIMNLAFFKPKKDQCNVCCQYEEGNLSEADYNKHIDLKNKARSAKEEDKERCQTGNDMVVLTVDVQCVLVAPSLQASSMFFKTKLACHNYTIYDVNTHKTTCYFWHEGEGNLDADSFASCLIDYITHDESCREASTIVIYSDGCPYQNRNCTLANALLQFSNQHGKTVIQKFLEKGHTQMECDSVHARCEKAFRGKKIYVPYNYVELIHKARRILGPYNVKYLSHEFFLTYSSLNFYPNIRPGKKAGDPVVTDIRQMLYSNGCIKYKLNFEEGEFQQLPSRIQENGGTVSRKHNEKLKIKASKFQHLQELKQYIPGDYHHFYDALGHQ